MAKYLDSYYTGLLIDHIAIHSAITTYLQQKYNIIPTNTIAIASGGNSIIVEVTQPSPNPPIYLKVAHAQETNIRGVTTEQTADNMLLESILAKSLPATVTKKLLAGIDISWQLTKDTVKQLAPTKEVKKPLYNAALILQPTVPSMTLNKLLNQYPDFIKTPLFETFLKNIVRLGFEYSFVHNDLHGGNVLAVLDTNNKPIAYKIIDLGRAYCLLPVNKTLLQNEYAKLMPPPQLDEPLSSFTNRVNKIQSIYDCITPANTSGWIKVNPAGSSEFQQRSLILFDVIGLLNGLGYFKGREDTLSKKPQALPINTIYELLDYWYGTYIYFYRQHKQYLPVQQIINDINQEVFLSGFWVDVACYNYLRDTFYQAITPQQSKIDSLITNFPQLGGTKRTSSSRKMSSPSPTDITPQPYGEILADIADAKAKLGKARKEFNPVQGKPTQTAYSALPATVTVRGGKKKKGSK